MYSWEVILRPHENIQPWRARVSVCVHFMKKIGPFSCEAEIGVILSMTKAVSINMPCEKKRSFARACLLECVINFARSLSLSLPGCFVHLFFF